MRVESRTNRLTLREGGSKEAFLKEVRLAQKVKRGCIGYKRVGAISKGPVAVRHMGYMGM